MYDLLLLGRTKSWFTGYNSNVEGHDINRYVIYNGGAPRYRKRLAEVAAEGYKRVRVPLNPRRQPPVAPGTGVSVMRMSQRRPSGGHRYPR